MKKILFPTDFSKASLNAFSYALHLAAKINAQIITIHVYDILYIPTENFNFLLENYNIIELSEFENYKSEVPKLRKIAEKLKLEHVKISHVLQEGNAVIEILNASIKEKADFIVMGTKGASGFKEVFLGTVTEKIINQSKIPVLAIPEEAKFKGIKKILFPIELEKLKLNILEKINDFAYVFNAKIDVLEVKTEKDKNEELTLNKWKEYRSVNFTIIHSNHTEGIISDYIEIHHIDITIMAVHYKDLWQRLFLYSLSRNMAHHIKIPLLSIPV